MRTCSLRTGLKVPHDGHGLSVFQNAALKQIEFGLFMGQPESLGFLM